MKMSIKHGKNDRFSVIMTRPKENEKVTLTLPLKVKDPTLVVTAYENRDGKHIEYPVDLEVNGTKIKISKRDYRKGPVATSHLAELLPGQFLFFGTDPDRVLREVGISANGREVYVANHGPLPSAPPKPGPRNTEPSSAGPSSAEPSSAGPSSAEPQTE